MASKYAGYMGKVIAVDLTTETVTVQGKEVKGPELETLGLLGGNICNHDLQKILDWNYLLDELGMDTISTANTIAWAMEANEKGLWNNGLKFGSVEELSAVFEDIAHRRGIGDESAEGSKHLSEKYGGKDFAMHSRVWNWPLTSHAGQLVRVWAMLFPTGAAVT